MSILRWLQVVSVLCSCTCDSCFGPLPLHWKFLERDSGHLAGGGWGVREAGPEGGRPTGVSGAGPVPPPPGRCGNRREGTGRSLSPSAAFTGELLCLVCSRCSWKRRESFAHSSIVSLHTFPVRLLLVAREACPLQPGPQSLQRRSVRVSECLPLWGSAHVALHSLSPNKPPGKGRGPLLVTLVISALLEHFLKETDPGKWPEGELILGKMLR